MITTQEIYQDIEQLSDEAKTFLFDFIQLLKQRYPHPQMDLQMDTESKVENDPLIGLFSGSLSLATESENILSSECESESG
ncbi:MAG: DUF2281 domain-containing protein [Limnothrix sp. RL_2_0]|nr:DUF2281 domain-containing protein [Limnothrix sp. RL_2_0]